VLQVASISQLTVSLSPYESFAIHFSRMMLPFDGELCSVRAVDRVANC
jgi:hypothetical protein